MDFGSGPRGGRRREGAGAGGEEGNQSCEERGREEGAECDFTAEDDRSTSPRNVEVGMG